MKKLTRRNRELAATRAALAACRERASVLAHERDRARALVAQLSAEAPAEPAAPLRTVGLAG
jgi:hypothetical protein